MTAAIQCKYSCFKCGLRRVTITVSERSAGRDIVQWMDSVAVAMSRDHNRRSPHCRINKLDEIMIPLFEDAPSIGAAGTVPMKTEES